MAKMNRNNGLILSIFPGYSGMIIAATLASTISAFVDGCITGGILGSNAMAAFGIAMPFVLIFVVVAGIILSSGGSICSSKAIGSGEREKANSNFTACLIMGVVVGVIALIICFVFPEQLISITGTDGDLAKEAAAYLRGYGAGCIPTVVLSILMYYANIDGNEKISFFAVFAMTVVDIALDLLLGVKMSMGMLGMALATSISYIVAVIIFIVFFLTKKSSFSICFKKMGTEVRDILKTGYPSALNTLLISCRCFFLNSLLLSLAGKEAVSAFSFQSNFNQFFVAIASGVSTAVSVLVGIYIGEKDRNGVRSSVKYGLRYGILFSAIFMVFLFIAAPLMTKLLLSGDAQGNVYAVWALRLFCLSMPLSIINIILISFYQTTGDRKIANIISIGHGLVLPLGCAYLFSLCFGLNGVWLSTLIAEFFMLVILAVILKIRTGKIPVKLEEFAVIDKRQLPEEPSAFMYSSAVNEINIGDVQEQFGKFLMEAKCDVNTPDQIQNVLSEILSEAKTQKGFVDIYSTLRDSHLFINIRVNGRNMDKLLNSPEWRKEKGIDTSLFEVSSHYSANISFMMIEY